MQKLAERINRLSESATIKMARLSRELKAQGVDIISLSLGEPDFHTPDHIKEAAIRAINENYSHYPPVGGYPELKEAIIRKYKNEYSLDYNLNQVVVSTGAKQSLINILLSIVEEGDEVVIPSPFWVTYPEMVKLAEGRMVNITTRVENDFKISPEQLDAALNEKTRVLLLCSPSNPTGSVYSQEELKGLVKVLEKYPNVIVISDEIYDYINFTGKSHSIAQIEGMYDRTVIVNGVSKGFAMTGWRIGFLVAPAWIAQACEKIQGQFTSGASTISQKAAEAALNSDLAPTFKMRDSFKRRRDLVVEKMREIPGINISVPQGAFYLFPDISAWFGKKAGDFVISDSEDFCMYVLESAKVSIVPGKAFGDDNCIRMSFAASDEDLTEAMRRLKEVLAKIE